MHFEWAFPYSTVRLLADKMSGNFSVIMHLLSLTAIFPLKFDLGHNRNFLISTMIVPGLLDNQGNEI